MFDGNVFFGLNDQRRRFADYSAWESQNWFMVAADRQSPKGRLSANLMLSLEPFTVADGGSPQLFQTGESYQGVPLVNFQHQHDLLMGLGVTYAITRPGVTYTVGADLVGSPTLGPTAFMHRASARNNPQAPLIHHYVDSTHITPGVVRGGVTFGSLTLEASAFRGASPDEDRVDIERPALDSWAARGRWRRGAWEAQVSGGHLKRPEWFEPFDATRITASISFDGAVRSRPLAMTLAWGENRQFNGFNGNVDGFLLEGDLRATTALAVYGRVEVAAKELFGLGPHPKEFVAPPLVFGCPGVHGGVGVGPSHFSGSAAWASGLTSPCTSWATTSGPSSTPHGRFTPSCGGDLRSRCPTSTEDCREFGIQEFEIPAI